MKYFLPALSGFLLILASYPVDFWPLAFFALGPLYFFLEERSLTRREVFVGGAIVGGMFAAFLSYFTVLQFHWLPDAYLFSNIIHLSVVPIVLFSAGVCGLSTLIYVSLKTHSAVLNTLVGAATFTAQELLLQFIFGGYYLGSLAYAATRVTALMDLSAVGGMPLVSFLLSFVNVAIAQIAVHHDDRVRFVQKFIVPSVLVCFIVGGNWYYLHRLKPTITTVTVVTIQSLRSEATFGKEKEGIFSFPELEARFKELAADAPDLIIYPFSPVEGAIYHGTTSLRNSHVVSVEDRVVADWLAHVAPSSSVVMTWNTLYENETFTNVYEFWRGGKGVVGYRKRTLFPFLDYTPLWAQRMGLFTTSFDESVGPEPSQISINGAAAGSLLCSEVTHSELARVDAERSLFIIAAGSEAMFSDDVAGQFNLRAAQYRAAENNIPVIRANLLGPSALIAADGSLLTSMPRGEAGIMRGSLALSEPLPTLYKMFGNRLSYLLLLTILLAALIARRISGGITPHESKI